MRLGSVRECARLLRGGQEQGHANGDEFVHNESGVGRYSTVRSGCAVYARLHVLPSLDIRNGIVPSGGLRPRRQRLHLNADTDRDCDRSLLRDCLSVSAADEVVLLSGNCVGRVDRVSGPDRSVRTVHARRDGQSDRNSHGLLRRELALRVRASSLRNTNFHSAVRPAISDRHVLLLQCFAASQRPGKSETRFENLQEGGDGSRSQETDQPNAHGNGRRVRSVVDAFERGQHDLRL